MYCLQSHWIAQQWCNFCLVSALSPSYGAWHSAVWRCHSACAAVQVMEEIVQRTASAMVDRGTPFSGVLFAGLMIRDGKVRSNLLVPQHTAGNALQARQTQLSMEDDS